MCYCESFTESELDVKYVSTVKEINNLICTCFRKESNVSNKTFENKSIAKEKHRVQNKLAGCKIFLFKYANRNVTR